MTDAYLRFPHIRDSLLVFAAEDDVWLAPLDGGRAYRLTADHEPVDNPRLSPDATRVAWTSRREGAAEVHVAPVDGGTARRLTYWGEPNTRVLGWLSDDRVLAVSTVDQGSRRRSWAYAVPIDGGPAERLPYGPVGGVAPNPAGPGTLLVSAAMSRDAAQWKRYRGGTAGKLWIDRTGDGEFVRVHEDLDANIESPMWLENGRIAFLADHEGVGHLYSSLPDGTDLTRHTSGDWYARNAATDGTRVVWQSAGDLHLLDSLDGTPRKLDVRLGGPRTARAPQRIDAAEWLGDLTVDRTGRASAVEVRGTVHWLTHRDGPVRALADAPGVRGRLPVVLGDTGRAAWVTDAEGEDALEIAPVNGTAVDGGSEKPQRLASGRLGRVLELAASPDGTRLAAAAHDGRLLVIDTATGSSRELAASEWGDVDGLAFSPDSRWLAWSQPGLDRIRQIRLADLREGTVLDATPLRFHDFSPAFTADGKYLAFLSYRDFDPVYDSHAFDLSFPGGCRPQLLALAADTPSPFAPRLGGRPFEDEDDEHGKDADREGGKNDGKKDDTPPITRVDAEGLDQRAVPFPVPAGQYDRLRAAKGAVLWLREPITGRLGTDLAGPDADRPRPVLERFDLAAPRTEELVDGLDGYHVSGDGTRVAIQDGKRLLVRPTAHKVEPDDHPSASDDIAVDLGRIRVTVDPGAEWRQEFDENGRLMRDHFWRADLGGVDWDAVLRRYRPLVERVGSTADLVDVLWETVGELGTSHAYVIPPGAGKPHRVRQGLLGADWRVEDGRWTIARVIPGEPSDPLARSPLTAPGVAMRAGDVVVAVDGRAVDPVAGPGPLLVGTAGKPVELTVDPAGGGERRTVAVVPLGDETPLRYQDRVNERRAYVLEKSGGKLGYLHVPDMQAVGWAQLHRDLRTQTARDGLVVDIRENGGGHTSQLVLQKISGTVIGWDVSRGSGTESYPQHAPRGPVVVVTNEFAGSDGDIIAAAVQSTGLGPVIGTRSWGGVVGIDGRYQLVDGTTVTQPRYAFWFAQHGWGVENHGVDPDIEVVKAPQHWAADEDPQLDRAIEEALARLEA
ncbi:peptidase S41, partial [Mangrovactinospora gilvigrisea]